MLLSRRGIPVHAMLTGSNARQQLLCRGVVSLMVTMALVLASLVSASEEKGQAGFHSINTFSRTKGREPGLTQSRLFSNVLRWQKRFGSRVDREFAADFEGSNILILSAPRSSSSMFTRFVGLLTKCNQCDEIFSNYDKNIHCNSEQMKSYLAPVFDPWPFPPRGRKYVQKLSPGVAASLTENLFRALDELHKSKMECTVFKMFYFHPAMRENILNLPIRRFLHANSSG